MEHCLEHPLPLTKASFPSATAGSWREGLGHRHLPVVDLSVLHLRSAVPGALETSPFHPTNAFVTESSPRSPYQFAGERVAGMCRLPLGPTSAVMSGGSTTGTVMCGLEQAMGSMDAAVHLPAARLPPWAPSVSCKALPCFGNDHGPPVGAVLEVECIPKLVIIVSDCIPGFRSVCPMCIPTFKCVYHVCIPTFSSFIVLRAQFPSPSLPCASSPDAMKQLSLKPHLTAPLHSTAQHLCKG